VVNVHKSAAHADGFAATPRCLRFLVAVLYVSIMDLTRFYKNDSFVTFIHC